MARIGLLGGSFNPVHLGHLLVAQAAREELQLSRLFFVPAAQSPFKPGLPLAPAEQRLCLLRLALAGQTDCEIDDQEIKRGGVSYTIDTVRDYARRFPGAPWFYLIGADHVPLLPKWRAADELPGPFRGRALAGYPLGVSSSQVRERVKAGLPVDLLVGPAVAESIRNNRLY